MIWILLAIVLLAGIITAAVMMRLSSARYLRRAEEARIAFQVRRAELRLHQIARDAFQAMLDETRNQQPS